MEENSTPDIEQLPLRWLRLMQILKEQFGREPLMEELLFLIGLRELGRGPGNFSKEEKVDMMHIALCAILAPSGYYRLSHLDQEGWPHWEAVKPLPYANIFAQELFLKSHIVDYFEPIYGV